MVLSLEHMPQDKLYRIGNDVLLLDELMVADTYPSHFRTCRGTKCQFRGRRKVNCTQKVRHKTKCRLWSIH